MQAVIYLLFLAMALCRTWCVPLISCCSAKRGAHFSAEANYISEKCVCVCVSVSTLSISPAEHRDPRECVGD